MPQIIHSVYSKYRKSGNNYNPLYLPFFQAHEFVVHPRYISFLKALLWFNSVSIIALRLCLQLDIKVMLATMAVVEQTRRNSGVSAHSFASWINWSDKRGTERCFAWVYKSWFEPKRQHNLWDDWRLMLCEPLCKRVCLLFVHIMKSSERVDRMHRSERLAATLLI